MSEICKTNQNPNPSLSLSHSQQETERKYETNETKPPFLDPFLLLLLPFTSNLFVCIYLHEDPQERQAWFSLAREASDPRRVPAEPVAVGCDPLRLRPDPGPFLSQSLISLRSTRNLRYRPPPSILLLGFLFPTLGFFVCPKFLLLDRAYCFRVPIRSIGVPHFSLFFSGSVFRCSHSSMMEKIASREMQMAALAIPLEPLRGN